MPTQTMWELSHGQSATVIAVTASGAMRRRLQDIGLVTGARVECINRGMFGEPTAFCIRGAVVALRRKDAESVIVESVR